jgi:polysaccharide export outer membrane protein
MTPAQFTRHSALRAIREVAAVAVLHALALANVGAAPPDDSSAPPGAPATSLLRIEPAGGERAIYRLLGDGPLPYRQTSLADPPRVVLELPGVTSRLAVGPSGVDEGPVASVKVETFREGDVPGTRLVFNLRGPHTCAVEATPGGLDLKFFPEIAQAPQPAAAAAAGAPPDRPGGDAIGVEDLVEIRVFELPELQSVVRVKSDGAISLPLLGVLQIAGLTERALEARLREILEARFVNDPHVSVVVREHESRKVSVVGAVAKPGAYVLLGERTLLQMILEAGGLTRDAGTEAVILREGGPGDKERIRVDLRRLMVQPDPTINIPIRPGDAINVPPDESIYIYVDGAVKNPGQIETRHSRPLTLLQAIIRAGGTTDAANARQVRVLRKTAAGAREQLVVDMKKIRQGKMDDIYLQDGDIVVVPEALF